MPTRYRSYGPKDESPNTDGDTAFIGVDERIDPANLPPGYVSRGKNVRFRTGEIRPRGGSVIMPWMAGNGTTSYTNVQGAGVFSDPDGQEWMIICADEVIYRTRPNNISMTIPLNSNTVTGDVQFTQCFEKLICWRGDDLAPLVMNSFGDGWRTIAQADLANNGMDEAGTKDIPNSDHAEFFQSRLLVPFKRNTKKDLIAVGDIGDYTRYKYPEKAFRINEGDFDEIKRVVKFGRQAVVIFKNYSIVYVDGLVPDAAGNYSGAYLDEATDRHGLLARDSVAKWGDDLFYLSTDRTFTSLKLTVENKVKPGIEPLSVGVEESFRSRVNWGKASIAKAVAWNDNIYLAMPIDDANVLGPEEVPTAATYNSGTPTPYNLTGLTVGASYKITVGTAGNFDYVLDGTDKYYGPVEFVAQNTAVDIYPLQSGVGVELSVDVSIKEVIQESVNNGIFVYDTVNKAWAGLDEAEGVIMVKEWIKLTYQGQERLFYITNDGFIRLYEEGFYDEAQNEITPYVDVIMKEPAETGNTIQVNGGTVVTADKSSGSNTATTWGQRLASIPYTPVAAANLWGQGGHGYDPDSATTVWTAPDTTPSQIDYGVRFTSTDSMTPVVTTTGTWDIQDSHSTPQIETQDIPTEVLTRGYLAQEGERKKFNMVNCTMETWDPTYTIKVEAEGVAETQTIVNAKTRSNTTYDVEDATAWETDNSNDDHETPFRQDYSVGAVDLGVDPGATGIKFDLHQEVEERKQSTLKGRAAQIRITNTTGRCIVKQVKLETTAEERSFNTRT